MDKIEKVLRCKAEDLIKTKFNIEIEQIYKLLELETEKTDSSSPRNHNLKTKNSTDTHTDLDIIVEANESMLNSTFTSNRTSNFHVN